LREASATMRLPEVSKTRPVGLGTKAVVTVSVKLAPGVMTPLALETGRRSAPLSEVGALVMVRVGDCAPE